MATQFVISNDDYIKIDDVFHIKWADKGNAMPSLPNTIHYVIWNDLTVQNEIQSKDPATGNMVGNTDLNATSDAVGSTTVSDLLTWAGTRKGQIETAVLDHDTAYSTAHTAHVDGGGDPDAFPWSQTWIDYDPNYS